MIDKHTLTTLEFPRIIDLIGGKCRTPFGRSEVDEIAPLTDEQAIKRRLDEISQMKDIINFGQTFPLSRIEDCRQALKESQIEGNFLTPSEILPILELIILSIKIHGYDKDSREKFPAITKYLGDMRGFPELHKEITRTIDDDGDIRDNASPQLRRIRQELLESRQRVIRNLQKSLSRQEKRAGWQDDVVTIRNDRYVIPVPAAGFREDMGILHDRSQSGATFYIEPRETVELNNKINILMQDERLEIDRILRALTAEIATRSEALIENCRLIGILDSIHACASFSIQIDGNQPALGEPASLNLIDMRHPLLIVSMNSVDKVIPNSISLDGSRQVIIVTGPNTGGKTVMLKTIGLSVLMAQSGLHIAAAENSSMGVFEKIYADIGDEQSLEQSLSTFSSHIKNVVEGLNNADERSLLLFDEIGVGTDPQEGSALAEAIILHATEKGARMIATTHYSQLKILATEHPQIENASLEFDRERLAPTFRMHLGLPGSSYAIDIARRLGVPDSVCDKAASLAGSGEKELSLLISLLEADLSIIRQDKTALSDRLKEAEKLKKFYEEKNLQFKSGVDKEKKQALQELNQFVDDTRKEVERLVAEIRHSQASKRTLKEFHETISSRSEEMKKELQRQEEQSHDQTSYKIGDNVEILSLNQQGVIGDLIGRNKARIMVGNVQTTVEIRNLRKIDAPSTKPTGTSTTSFSIEPVDENQIHLRGMTVDEAMESLERFLDRAVIAGFGQVYVIHGKGTGKLRRTLTEYLKQRPEVASLRLGNWNEGGAGVTIVKLN